MQRSRYASAIFTLWVCMAASACLAAAQETASLSTQDPLVTLNEAFRAEYKNALAEVLAQTGPVILSVGDELVFLHNGSRQQAVIKPPIYHTLKAVAHIPLALYVMLAFETDNAQRARLARLEHYRALLLQARASLASHRFTPEQLARQKHIVAASLDLLDQVIATKQVSKAHLERFTRAVAPLLWANVNEATHSTMAMLYAQMAQWRQAMTPEEWRTFHVIVIGAHMPREQEISYQYFARLLNQTEEGQRLIYAEALWKEQEALNLLATHIVDGAVGGAFFGDPRRMHRDLLADAAKAYLDTHPVNP